MKNESKKLEKLNALRKIAQLRDKSYNNWGYIDGYKPSESERLMEDIISQCHNIADGEHNGLYIKTSRDEYLTFLYELYNKLISEGCTWCDN